ncbi:rhodanese-like domain-containing protein [Desulfovibrio sp.]|uniref:rhodanese-like domain-containing protein n=1 Tax=Desulfovibrio sp. TaxID=885 RepID=UPI0025BFD588|nr:rhodanese-like domain-containing protein [Desulfovibrio sp.]
MTGLRRCGRPAPLFVLALAVLALALWGPAPACARDAAPMAADPAAIKCLPAPGDISVGQAKDLLAAPPAGLVILDVRTPQEFRQGHLPGARNMDFFGGSFERQTEALPKDAPVLLYCRTGKRSAAAAETLGEAGVKHIYHMHQGIEAWQQAGLPLEK